MSFDCKSHFHMDRTTISTTPWHLHKRRVWFYQSLFKTSPVTRRPSLKRRLGIQEQLLSLCMGTCQILQNCSLCLRLNFIFEITNEIWQQLCHKCCFFCSNSVIKNLFLRLDQSLRMHSPERESQSADCFYSNQDFEWQRKVTRWRYRLALSFRRRVFLAILSVALFPIQNYTSDMY